MEKLLCVATNWDDEFLRQLEEQGLHKKIYELFGSLKTSIIGSGRPSSSLPEVSFEAIKRHIEKVHSLGLKFNYLLNAPCLGNVEFEKGKHKKILTLLNWLDKCRVDTVTVTVPYLVDIIKKYFRMEVNVSTIAHVNSISKAKLWEKMGVDRITIDFMMNRDFEFLKNIGDTIKCKLEVIVNDLCLFGCPFRYYHYNVTAHASQEVNKKNLLKHQLACSYPIMKCTLIKLTDFSEIIKSRWIRPEDIRFYRKLGIDFFKISGRTRNTNALLKYVKAYAEETYEGNLLDIVKIPTAGIEDIRSLLSDPPIYVDNKKLEGFLDYFQSGKCRTNCFRCNYCNEVAKRVISITDQKKLDKIKAILIRRIISIIDFEEV